MFVDYRPGGPHGDVVAVERVIMQGEGAVLHPEGVLLVQSGQGSPVDHQTVLSPQCSQLALGQHS